VSAGWAGWSVRWGPMTMSLATRRGNLYHPVHKSLLADIGYAPRAASAGSLARTFLLVFIPVAVVLLLAGRVTYFGPAIYETSDYAANSLQIANAERFAELLGNYSRFGFHHPGPAFFYVYAVGEILFRNALHLSAAPFNAYLLAGVLLQASFFSAGLAIISLMLPRGRGVFLVAACGIAAIHFGLAQGPEFSIWPPYVLVMPFVCFLAAAAAVASGWVTPLPVLALAGSFLVHGHAAQPLFVVPIFLVAYGSLCLRWRDRGLAALFRGTWRPHLLSILVVVPFLTTIILNALIAQPSNLALILGKAGSGGGHSPIAAVSYIVGFLDYGGTPTSVLGVDQAAIGPFLASHGVAIVIWAGLILVPLVLIMRAGRFADALPFYAVVAVASGLAVFWAVFQQGTMWAFNSFFVYGLLYVALLPLAALIAVYSAPRLRNAVIAATAIALIVATSLQSATPGPSVPDPRGAEIEASVKAVVAADPSRTPRLLTYAPDMWAEAFAVALNLERNGIPFLVRPPGGLWFGYDHVQEGQEAINWQLIRPDGRAGEIRLSSDLALLIQDPPNTTPAVR
jgi:hypothetical protein